jgi:hypothetical protein
VVRVNGNYPAHYSKVSYILCNQKEVCESRLRILFVGSENGNIKMHTFGVTVILYTIKEAMSNVPIAGIAPNCTTTHTPSANAVAGRETALFLLAGGWS